MKTKLFPYKNVHDYLEATGILETGTAEDITQARKTFRKLYLQQYRKQYGKKHASVNIVFTKKDKQLLQHLAMENGKKLASFIKAIALDRLHGKAVIHTTLPLSDIKKQFSLSYDIVEQLQFENNYPELKSAYDKLEQLLGQIERLLNDY